MKKILLILLLLPVLAISQKISLKKDKILSGDKEVAIMKETSRDNYDFSALDGTKVFSVKYNSLMQDKQVAAQWLTITNPDNSKKSEIEYEVLITAFSTSKIILNLLSQKYGLIDANGINTAKLDEFFETHKEDLDGKYRGGIAGATAEAAANKADFDAKVGRIRPFVKNDGTVVFGGQMGKDIVGKVMGISNFQPLGQNAPIQVFDLDGIQVARAELNDKFENDVKVTLFNNDTFTYRAKRRYAHGDNTLFHQQLIEELVSRVIMLGHQAKTYDRQLQAKKVALAKERSINVYQINGYAVDEKGVKYTGKITCQFEKLDVNQTGDNQVVDAIDNYGKKVTVKYLNEKGKERSTTLTANDKTYFCVDGKEQSNGCYYGMKVKGDSAKKLSNAMSLGFTNAYFYKLLFEENGNQLLVDPIETDRFVIKLKNKDEGQMIDRRNNEKLSAALAEYLKDCPELSKEIAAGKMDLKLQESLETIIKEYNQCKK
ncbi:hypothetical protein [Flavobacterium silvaticum]|uniref:Uncharacterized protein n=1 Tax=Flavobacterium silvaticum TaxID=1852020 RepID=A0A972FM99_9FLAO|nr:hypothetical protein [Flavobacterium silvaticum]NMH28338.1 hypothetical protein [Flavobacterium silvaticum]